MPSSSTSSSPIISGGSLLGNPPPYPTNNWAELHPNNANTDGPGFGGISSSANVTPTNGANINGNGHGSESLNGGGFSGQTSLNTLRSRLKSMMKRDSSSGSSNGSSLSIRSESRKDKGKEKEKEGSSPKTLKSRGDELEGLFECHICLDTASEPVVSLCGHLFCWPHLLLWDEHCTKEAPRTPAALAPTGTTCPVCKTPLEIDKVIPIYGRGREDQEDPRTRRPRPRPRPSLLSRSATSPPNIDSSSFWSGGSFNILNSGSNTNNDPVAPAVVGNDGHHQSDGVLASLSPWVPLRRLFNSLFFPVVPPPHGHHHHGHGHGNAHAHDRPTPSSSSSNNPLGRSPFSNSDDHPTPWERTPNAPTSMRTPAAASSSRSFSFHAGLLPFGGIGMGWTFGGNDTGGTGGGSVGANPSVAAGRFSPYNSIDDLTGSGLGRARGGSITRTSTWTGGSGRRRFTDATRDGGVISPATTSQINNLHPQGRMDYWETAEEERARIFFQRVWVLLMFLFVLTFVFG